MTTCIVLNADYTFLNVISIKKAMTLLSKGKADVLKYGKDKIKTTMGAIRVPLVLRLIKLIRTIYKARVPFSKKNVMVRDHFKCAYCGKEGVRLTIDHIVPKARGGKSTFENCVASCKPCNTKKGHKSCAEARMYPSTRAIQPTIMQFLQMKMKSLGIDKVLSEMYSG
jgi:5-methylcytosine-specific restriction endonuclease McrA